MAREAMEHFRQYADSGDVPVSLYPGLVSIAAQARDFDLARRLAGDWHRHAPDDPEPLVRRGQVEYRAGAYGPAVHLAQQVLERWPQNADAAKLLRDARAALRKQAADLAPEPPGG
jgi:Tfp pilus assembly protein PilF